MQVAQSASPSFSPYPSGVANHEDASVRGDADASQRASAAHSSVTVAGSSPASVITENHPSPSLDDAGDGGGQRTAPVAGTSAFTSFLQQVGDLDGKNASKDSKPAKPKQKRNKPTLSCLECVDRKTKCDRGRPCLACVKRQSGCEYTAVANLIASTDRKNLDAASRSRYVTKPPSKVRKLSHSSSATSPIITDNGWSSIDRASQKARHGSSSSPHMLSNVPYTKNTPSNVFGVGKQHPFGNYWTCGGGLSEVISVLPSKEQTDILVAKYFESFDPVYPCIHRRTFYSDYERFFNMSWEEKCQVDASMIALHFAVYAIGTQYVQFMSFEERARTSEFYCSAANQALRIYSYLNKTSMRAIAAMLLMTYFLMNDCHASDAYSWAGIHLRQAYAMRLHRDPEIVVPNASVVEKQQRRKLWQAMFLQDTFMTVLLKLPPTATHSDVPVEGLSDENEQYADGIDFCSGVHSRVENLMSINVIAPPPDLRPPPLPHQTVDPETGKRDLAYLRSMWHLGNLVQENISSPNSLSLPLSNSARHRESLVGAFRRLYKSFPSFLTTLDYAVLRREVVQHPRGVRQNLFLTSNYFHCLMMLQASTNEAGGVECNVKGALEAAHEALWAFFKYWGLFEQEASISWSFQHRAFEGALAICHLLSLPRPVEGLMQAEPMYEKARQNVIRVMEIMDRYSGPIEVNEERKEVLQQAYEKIGL
ncbi:hypothetical protein K431DRAFT_265455 [Polychaeton citri CBS 116435]|uniref:Zn(2)-C6 fungal-type domain-containing protein n=1 Tax=Polychaeton citri CBS 116435 TaxID=1314669 RepID=A0A9P4Q964_9PEZI|nr:hypothetical protein K431DRAFT_265455 [Polychaeton citri CBS 116435]